LDSHSDILRAAKGDHLAFARLVGSRQGRIFGYLGRIGLDAAAAGTSPRKPSCGSGAMPDNSTRRLGKVVE